MGTLDICLGERNTIATEQQNIREKKWKKMKKKNLNE